MKVVATNGDTHLGGEDFDQRVMQHFLVTDYSFLGDNTCFAVSYSILPTSPKPGGIILYTDGFLFHSLSKSVVKTSSSVKYLILTNLVRGRIVTFPV